MVLLRSGKCENYEVHTVQSCDYCSKQRKSHSFLVFNCTPSPFNSTFLFQVVGAESPHMRGVGPMGHHTPLAMLAAQCNKLTSKTPPPLADAAVGKGFHPWKKSGQSTGGSVDESSSVGKSVGTGSHSGPNSPASVHSVHSPHQPHLSHNNSSPAPNLNSYSDRKSEYFNTELKTNL